MLTLAGLTLGLWLVAAAAWPAAGQTPGTVHLEELTWTEVRDAIRSGKTTMVVPIGGTEQNGPHMALGKHTFRVKALAERIALLLGDALVAPPLAYVPEGGLDPPTGHMRFPGTITVAEDTFRKLLGDAARSFKLHGFRDVVLLGDSGSTLPGLHAVAARLNREWAATPARVHAVEDYYRASSAGFRELLKARGYRPEESGSHAGLADTSLTLAVDPRLVRADRMRPGTGLTSGDGVEGDPSRSTAELGRLGTEMIVARTVEAIRKATARPK